MLIGWLVSLNNVAHILGKDLTRVAAFGLSLSLREAIQLLRD